MALIMVLGVIVLITFAVIGILFFMLGKEGKKEEMQATPMGLDQVKKELSSQIFEQKSEIEKDSETIPVFAPQVSLPVQAAQAPLDDPYKLRAEELENELVNISVRAQGQAEEARQMILTLTAENESLKKQQADLEEAREKLSGLEAKAVSLQSENVDLQAKFDGAQSKVRLLEEEMAAVKVQMGEEIHRANATVTSLQQEQERLLSAPKPDPDGGLRQEIDSLKVDYAKLKEKCEDLEKSQYNLRVMNSQLSEKNEAIEYELIKARAQSSGLERVSSNYKNQLEDFFRRINEAQASHEQLSQVKNRLEGMLEEIRQQNEELVRKDHLAQFELEKNRNRMLSLEREYEDFKARAQQNNSS